jgi:hypothetical protein
LLAQCGANVDTSTDDDDGNKEVHLMALNDHRWTLMGTGSGFVSRACPALTGTPQRRSTLGETTCTSN